MSRTLLLGLCALLVTACGSADGPNDPSGDLASGGDLGAADGDAIGGGDGDAGRGDASGGDGRSGGDTSGGDTGPTRPQGREFNTAWVGGKCASASECSSSAFTRTAECETQGFPNGFCTQDCTLGSAGRYICPDDTASADASGTKCVADDAGDPKCVGLCDFDLSPTGCRPGYVCVLQQRYETSTEDQIFPVCMPEATQRWPGTPAPPFDIGAACLNGTTCSNLACLKFSGGYCTKLGCELAGCPSGSTCFQIGSGDNAYTACLKDCAHPSECRAPEGYICPQDADACVPNMAPPPHDPSVAAADCQQAWGTAGSGLHACDTVPDQYVVVNKRARNIALCNAGVVVATFNTGLGFSPTGDKQLEGDGRTPEGTFYVARRLPTSDYYRAFLVSYPDKADAAWGYSNGHITASVKGQIDAAQDGCNEPPQNTSLGGFIEIHGEHRAGSGDWTWGCMALENGQVDQLWATIDTRDTIVIKP